VFSDGVELARSPDVDLVIVSSTPDNACPLCDRGARGRKHVLCEKPMAIDAFEAAQMVDSIRTAPRQSRLD